jgi:hypothetical protein
VLSAAVIARDMVPDPAELLAEYAVFVGGLSCGAQTKRLRQRAARALLEAHPDLPGWMTRPAGDRIIEVRRLGAWPFLSWCFATGRIVPDLDLLVSKGKGAHFSVWVTLHPEQYQRACQAAEAFEWCRECSDRVTGTALPLACMVHAKALDELTETDLNAVEQMIDSSSMLSRIGRTHLLSQHRALRALCYQLRIIDTAPVHANRRDITPAGRAAAITQPEIRRVVERYLNATATVVRPKTIAGRAAAWSCSPNGSTVLTPR